MSHPPTFSGSLGWQVVARPGPAFGGVSGRHALLSSRAESWARCPGSLGLGGRAVSGSVAWQSRARWPASPHAKQRPLSLSHGPSYGRGVHGRLGGDFDARKSPCWQRGSRAASTGPQHLLCDLVVLNHGDLIIYVVGFLLSHVPLAPQGGGLHASVQKG